MIRRAIWHFKPIVPVKGFKFPRWYSSKNILLPKFATVANLATMFNVRVVDLKKKMEELGFSETGSDHIIDDVSAQIIAEELGVDASLNQNHGPDLYPAPLPDNLEECPPRPPVIALMGHVDHGKTTLLDHFRTSHLVDGEKGGITQHIGAFSSVFKSTKQPVCFLDTPGHEAFLKLRQRGANLTDIILLVVAADDGVMPQTKEAIKHAKAANVPMVVALTKIDVPESNPARAVAGLAAAGVDVEEYGGETQCIPVSAVTKEGVDDLESALTALVDVLDLRAPLDGSAEGVIVESQQVKGQGHTATIIMRRGTLNPRDVLVAGHTWCRTRQLFDEKRKSLKKVLPAVPVQISGWKDLPEPGQTILQAKSEEEAKKVVANRLRLLDEAKEAERVDVINEIRKKEHIEAKEKELRDKRANLGLEANTEDHASEKYLEYLIKADVGGSAEALTDCINDLGNDEVKAKVLYSAVGPVTETDVFRAETANATILAFATQVPRQIERIAEKHKVKIEKYDVIYKALENVSASLSSLLPPEISRKVIATATLRQVFKITVKKSHIQVAGVKVVRGSFSPKTLVQVLRNGKVVYDGKLSSIKHGKDTVEQAHKGSEYGFSFEKWEDFREGDEIEGYEEVSTPRYL